MSTTPPSRAPAGWYPDPWASGGHRWWDGTAWDTQLAPPQAVDLDGAVAAAARKAATRALVYSIVGLVINPFFSMSILATGRTLQARRLAGRVPGAVSRTKLGWAAGLTIASYVLTVLGFLGLLLLHLGQTPATHHASSPPHHETAFESKLHRVIASGIADKGLHLTVTSVACPVSSGFHPGQEFECVATASDGSTAKVRVDVQADGTYTWVILG